MKTIKFKNTYINLENHKKYTAGAIYDKDKNIIRIYFMGDNLKSHIDIPGSENVENNKANTEKINKEVISYIDSFLVGQVEYLNLNEYISRYLKIQNLI